MKELVVAAALIIQGIGVAVGAATYYLRSRRAINERTWLAGWSILIIAMIVGLLGDLYRFETLSQAVGVIAIAAALLLSGLVLAVVWSRWRNVE